MPNAADLEWAIEDVRSRQEAYALFRAYDEGDHRLLFATEKYKNTFGEMFREFANNMCDDVVDGLSDRLQILGWTTTKESGLGDLVDEVWERNRGSSRTGAVHRNAVREGDGFTIVQLVDGKAQSYKQNPACMAIRYSTENPDEKDLAAKVWKAGKRYRCNLYYPDGTIEKYATKGTAINGGLPKAGAFSLLEAGDPALGDATDAVSKDFDQMPVFHYPNGEPSSYGRSVLIGVIPLQDGLNKSCADMMVTMEAHAAPLRYGTGIEVERDPVTGQEIDPFNRASARPGAILRTASKDARFGQFDAATLTGFLEVQDQFKVDIVRKGSLPPHSVTLRSGSVGYPSGVALLVAEGKTIKWAKDRQRDWGTEHRAEMAYQLSLETGRPVDPEDLEIEWAPPETKDEKALLETLLMKRDLGVPDSQLLREAGYSGDQVEEFEEEKEGKEESNEAVLSVLQGGRKQVSPRDAKALQAGLPLPEAE